MAINDKDKNITNLKEINKNEEGRNTKLTNDITNLKKREEDSI